MRSSEEIWAEYQTVRVDPLPGCDHRALALLDEYWPAVREEQRAQEAAERGLAPVLRLLRVSDEERALWSDARRPRSHKEKAGCPSYWHGTMPTAARGANAYVRHVLARVRARAASSARSGGASNAFSPEGW